MARKLFVLLHRWFGLFTAVFLFISGLTGAIISWDHELDEWLNPQLFDAAAEVQDANRYRSGLDLANQVEAADPHVRVSFTPLAAEPGHNLMMSVDPRIDPATGKPYELGFNQIAVDPVTGEIRGRRMWGEISLARENLLPFLYKLHYSMHIPDGFGVELGVWFMGIVGIVWAIDCFVALWLSFPKWSVWRRSFAFRWKKGGEILTFDLHRSGGVWVWGLLLVVAVTSVSMNLGNEVTRPIVSAFSGLSPSPFASRSPRPPERPIEPLLAREQVIAAGRSEAARRDWREPVGGIFHSQEFGIYGVGFFEPGHDHGDGGLGNAWLYYDSRSGSYAGAQVPGEGSAGDIFMQAQFPLHSGRIIGLPGRILMSAMGLIVAILSLTGIIIWARKRKARQVRSPVGSLAQA